VKDLVTVGLYDPQLVIVELGTICILPINGLAKVEGAIKVFTERRFATRRGCDGEVWRTALPGRGGKLQLTLMQSSVDNDILAATRLIDQVTNAIVSPIAIIDANGNGNRVMWAERAWQEGPPTEISLGPSPGPLLFEFQLDGLEVVLGSLRRPGQFS